MNNRNKNSSNRNGADLSMGLPKENGESYYIIVSIIYEYASSNKQYTRTISFDVSNHITRDDFDEEYIKKWSRNEFSKIMDAEMDSILIKEIDVKEPLYIGKEISVASMIENALTRK